MGIALVVGILASLFYLAYDWSRGVDSAFLSALVFLAGVLAGFSRDLVGARRKVLSMTAWAAVVYAFIAVIAYTALQIFSPVTRDVPSAVTAIASVLYCALLIWACYLARQICTGAASIDLDVPTKGLKGTGSVLIVFAFCIISALLVFGILVSLTGTLYVAIAPTLVLVSCTLSVFSRHLSERSSRLARKMPLAVLSYCFLGYITLEFLGERLGQPLFVTADVVSLLIFMALVVWWAPICVVQLSRVAVSE